MSLVTFGLSGLVTLIVVFLLAPRLKGAGIVARDLHKPDQPQIPTMGGLAIIAGFSAGILLAVGLSAFLPSSLQVKQAELLALLGTVLLIAIIGIIDDLLGMRQWAKALLPLVASLPLVAIKAGHTQMTIPLIWPVDFGIFYPLFLVPLGVTGAANAVNMLAGFNGLEAGMGALAVASMAIIAYSIKSTTALIIASSALGALLATLYFNWYPAKVFIGDVGTLSIGAIIASAVIIGNFEAAGVILIIPYAVDFLLKAKNRFPSSGWWGIYNDGKLYCPPNGPVGLCQLVMKIFGGIYERSLVLILIGLEELLGLVAIGLYARF